MRKIIFQSSISLDGFIEGPNGELDWLVEDGEANNETSFLSDFDTIFYGRKTYEKMGVQEFMEPDLREVQKEFLYVLHGMRKYVFSRQKKHVSGNAMVVGRDLESEVVRIREEDGKNIWLRGGADILRTFADLDLVDEYLLMMHPVVLGSGKPLFGGMKKPLYLKLISERTFKSGVVILHYKPEIRLKNDNYDGRSV